jgi:adenosine deaminase CECR1
LLSLLSYSAHSDWFDDIKAQGNAEDLYRVLYYMPKGGDLHNHLSGAAFPEWWYEAALAQKARGYEYYTKVRIENCRDYGGNEFGGLAYYLMFRNIMAVHYEDLSDCEKDEYKLLADLTAQEKTAWMDSIRLDKPYEGREEFFQTHWQRLFALVRNPWLQAEMMYRNMQAFGAEGVTYLELQVAVGGFLNPDGSDLTQSATADILRQRIQQQDAIDTGVIVRLQIAVLRFLPNAEDALRSVYRFVHANNDVFVAVNMVGREDNDRGFPMRFLPTMRNLRRQYGGVRLSIHAGEVDEPNSHVRDTLLLGADRIGHGINLITDDETMRLMRHGPYLVEINLISNLLLGYVSDYSQHPFPEYLRTGIPLALSTDDRGMWDSTMTDEYFVAVTEFDLSWDEIRTLSRNSLMHAFTAPETKQQLLDNFEINYLDPGFKLPSEWKLALGISHILPGDYEFTADFLYTRIKYSAMVLHGDLEQTGTNADGYPEYDSVREASFVLTNSRTTADSTGFALGISKGFENGFDFSLGYAWSDAEDIQPMTSSVAFSNYQNRAFFDPQEDVTSTSNYNIEHRVTATGTFRHDIADQFPLTISFYHRKLRPPVQHFLQWHDLSLRIHAVPRFQDQCSGTGCRA